MATREGQPHIQDTSWWICGSWRTRAPRCLEAEREQFPEGHGPNGAETQGLDSLQVAGAGLKGLDRRPPLDLAPHHRAPWSHRRGEPTLGSGLSREVWCQLGARTGIPTLEPHGGACVCACACVCPSERVSLVCVPLCMYL